jgi:hypothetical protein
VPDHSTVEALGIAAGGALFGWGLTLISARMARKAQRAQVREERVRQRQDEAAVLMDIALVEASNRRPGVFGGDVDPGAALKQVHDEWARGWVRSTVINDAELLDRYGVVGMITAYLGSDVLAGHGVDILLLTRAISNARRSLAHFRREEPLPAATFPGRALLNELTGAAYDVARYERVTDWLVKNPEPTTG